MRTLVTGAGGQLGRAVVADWGGRERDQVVALNRTALDITRAGDVAAAVRGYAPEVVVNAAAYTAVDACESDPEPGWAVNAGGAANLARACHEAGALLCHVSTDYVFDGHADRPYTEFDRPAPTTAYGRTKDAGEQLVRELCPRHQIVRTAWLHGPGGGTFVDTMLRLAAERGAVEVVTDQVGSPTFTGELVPALRRLVATERPGTYHLVCDGFASWYDLTEAAFALAGVNADLAPTDSAAFPRPAPRPANSRLDGVNARLAGVPALPHWRDALARFLGERVA